MVGGGGGVGLVTQRILFVVKAKGEGWGSKSVIYFFNVCF